MADLDDYGPFDAGLGANRNEDFWRDFFRHLTGSGVIDAVGNEFAVSERAAGANLSVDVATGECFIRGHWGESTAVKNLPISAGHATNPRIDRVVLRADFTANTISLEVLEGTPAGSPSAPALTQSSSRWEIPLAQISVPALDTSIGSAQITDQRTIIGWPIARLNTAPTDGQVLVWDATNGWQPETVSSLSAASARVRRSTTQSIPDSTTTAVSFDQELIDTDTMVNIGAQPTRITFTTGGRYLVGFNLAFEYHATGWRSASVRLGGSAILVQAISRGNDAGSQYTALTGSTIYDFSAGDYIELTAYQTSGGALNVAQQAPTYPVLWATKVP